MGRCSIDVSGGLRLTLLWERRLLTPRIRVTNAPSELRLGDRVLKTVRRGFVNFQHKCIGSPASLPPLDNGETFTLAYPATFRGSAAGVFWEDLGDGEFQQVELSVSLGYEYSTANVAFDRKTDNQRIQCPHCCGCG